MHPMGYERAGSCVAPHAKLVAAGIEEMEPVVTRCLVRAVDDRAARGGHSVESRVEVVTVEQNKWATDLTEAQWAVIEPLLPEPGFLAGSGGRPEAHCRRKILDAIFYVVDNGITWRALPEDFPPHSTVVNYFTAWEQTGANTPILEGLGERVRIAENRAAEPTAAVIDSASVPGTATVGADSPGY